MEYLLYVYSAKGNKELKPFRCCSCGRIVFRHSSNKIMLTNAYGAGIQDHPPGSNYIEHKCHSCKVLYKILFQ